MLAPQACAGFSFSIILFWVTCYASKDNKLATQAQVQPTGTSGSAAVADEVIWKILGRFSEVGDRILARGASGANIQLLDPGEKPASSATASQPLPLTGPVTSSLPALEDQQKHDQQQIPAANENSRKSLEEFEEQNMQQLLQREQRSKVKKVEKAVKAAALSGKGGKAKGKGAKSSAKVGSHRKQAMKRPAASTASSSACKAKAKAYPSASAGSLPRASVPEKRGCSKCRANGCPQCRDPSFSGQIWLKSEYLAYAKLHGLK